MVLPVFGGDVAGCVRGGIMGMVARTRAGVILGGLWLDLSRGGVGLCNTRSDG